MSCGDGDACDCDAAATRLAAKETSSSRRPACVRCGAPSILCATDVDYRCRQCFLLSCHQRFRGSLGKSRVNRPGDRVLLCYSGGSSSTVLLHMFYEGLHNVRFDFKRIVVEPVVLYVDESALWKIFPRSVRLSSSVFDNNEQLIKSVADNCKALGYPCYVVPLEAVFQTLKNDGELAFCRDIAQYSADTGKISETRRNFADENERTLQQLLHTAHSLSEQTLLISTLREQLMLLVARQLNITKIFTGENATRLAVDMLAKTAMGRGCNVPNDVATATKHKVYDSATMHRPLRDISSKEIAFYLHAACDNLTPNLQTFTIPTFPSTGRSERDSVQRCTEDFIVNILSEFPQTVNTLIRTATKLNCVANVGKPSSTMNCLLCDGILNMPPARSPLSLRGTTDHDHDDGEMPLPQLCYSCSSFCPPKDAEPSQQKPANTGPISRLLQNKFDA